MRQNEEGKVNSIGRASAKRMSVIPLREARARSVTVEPKGWYADVVALKVGGGIRGLVCGSRTVRLPARGLKALRQKARGVGGKRIVACLGLRGSSRSRTKQDIQTHNTSFQPTPLRGAAELHRWAS
jgi:hypothetical protein